MQIAVTLEVYKALTAELSYEGQSYDDVIRRLLGMDSPAEPEDVNPVIESLGEASFGLLRAFDPNSFYSRGLRLPDGTTLRAIYKGVPYIAKIENGQWIDMSGIAQSSPSAAASAITGNNVNGLRFWEALRPNDKIWRRLDSLVKS